MMLDLFKYAESHTASGESCKLETILLTMGKDGVLVLEEKGEKFTHIPSKPVD